MRSKGFTLIELLAVIVILAIIALVAVPIILNIINDSKINSQKRSIELYASAVKNSIGKYQLINNVQPTSIEQLDIEYEGDVVCSTSQLYESGKIYLTGCKVNGEDVDYTYGKQEGNNNNTSQTPQPVSFTTDSWATIKANKNSDVYQVGQEREVEIDGTSYTVRIANKSTPSACSGENYSQTACGFVVEFVDIIEKRVINSQKNNVGGYPASEMHEYLQTTLFSKLSSDLQNVIIDTKVISSYGSSDKGNFESTDNLYLLAPHEIWEEVSSNKVSSNDKSYSTTHQLDYYKGITTNTGYSKAIKKYEGTAIFWWLRAANYYNNTGFLGVHITGGWEKNNSHFNYGLAPAFRI